MSDIELVSITPDAEATILYIARVSSDQSNSDTKLLRYLIRNKHWSPFEMAHMTVGIRTSRAISQQILRHRSFSFQEFSQRYAEVQTVVFYAGRRQAEKDRQSSIDDLDKETQETWLAIQRVAYDSAIAHYRHALSIGIAREVARFVLPLASETQLYMSGSLRSWIHYFELRCTKHTQLEHREIANSIKEVFIEQLPIISDALWGHENQNFTHSAGARDAN